MNTENEKVQAADLVGSRNISGATSIRIIVDRRCELAPDLSEVRSVHVDGIRMIITGSPQDRGVRLGIEQAQWLRDCLGEAVDEFFRMNDGAS